MPIFNRYPMIAYLLIVSAVALIDMHCTACAVAPAATNINPTHEIQESVPIVEVHFANATANQDPSVYQVPAESKQSRSGARSLNALDMEPSTPYAKRQLELERLNQFRLEYNKYKILQQLKIKTDPANIKPLPSLGQDMRDKIISRRALNEPPPNYERGTKQKRSLRCDEVKAGEDTCCLQSFYVNFTAIGWDKWIMSPSGYQANYCRGPCDISHARFYHSTVLDQFSSTSLCCSPKDVSPIKVLFAEDGDTIQEQWLPEMTVNSCDCS